MYVEVESWFEQNQVWKKDSVNKKLKTRVKCLF